MESREHGTETASKSDREYRSTGLYATGDERSGGQVPIGTAGDYEGLVQAILSRVSRSSGERLGKIVDQLIKRERDKLAEAEECVQWYQREVEKYTASIKELEAMRSELND